MNKIEDDVHILAVCPYHKDLMTKRHGYVVKKVAKDLIKKHSTAKVWRERSWCLGTELLRPDITMVKDEEVKIIEITIPYEKSNTYLEQRRQEKINKYSQLLQVDELLQVQCSKGGNPNCDGCIGHHQ